jgi:FkbM family methyltransferase
VPGIAAPVSIGPHATGPVLGTLGAPKMEREVITRWFADKGDQTLRVDYPLTRKSVVLDIGGYEGNWAGMIDERYGCEIHIFEPVPEFAEKIRSRFMRRDNIRVHRYGISDKTQVSEISIENDGTSVYRNKGTKVQIQLKSARRMFRELGLERCGVDLMKINIEGSEFDLLPHLVSKGLVNHIRDIQVQFHDFVPDASARMEKIQGDLARTHALQWQYRFVWENWRSRVDAPRGTSL